jgi:hypothetical protein
MSIKPLLQALKDSEPLSAAEVRELTIRHVMSGHADPRNEDITRLLVMIYEKLWARDHALASDLISPDLARETMKSAFKDGYVHAYGGEHPNVLDYWVWPAAVPKDTPLPRELCLFIGSAIGRKTGADVRKWNDRADQKDLPSNSN